VPEPEKKSDILVSGLQPSDSDFSSSSSSVSSVSSEEEEEMMQSGFVLKAGTIKSLQNIPNFNNISKGLSCSDPSKVKTSK